MLGSGDSTIRVVTRHQNSPLINAAAPEARCQPKPLTTAIFLPTQVEEALQMVQATLAEAEEEGAEGPKIDAALVRPLSLGNSHTIGGCQCGVVHNSSSADPFLHVFPPQPSSAVPGV
jgi:hypothetical protein